MFIDVDLLFLVYPETSFPLKPNCSVILVHILGKTSWKFVAKATLWQWNLRIPLEFLFFQSLAVEFVSWTSQPLRLTPEKTPNELSLMIDMIVAPHKDPQNVKFIYRSLWDWILPFWCYRRTKHHGDPQMPRPVGWGPRKIASDSVRLPKKSGWILCLTMVYGRHNMT